MRLDLTEILSCPSCGPDRGFVAFVDRLEAGIIVQGRLDCPECEQRHPVVDGVLYMSDGSTETGAEDHRGLAEKSELAMALLGVPEAPEVILVGPGLDQLAAELAANRPSASLLCLTTAPHARAFPDRVHPIVYGETGTLPFRSDRIHAAVLSGAAAFDPAEIARVLVPGSRIVILEPGSGLPDLQALESISTLAADPRAAVLVASPLPAV